MRRFALLITLFLAVCSSAEASPRIEQSLESRLAENGKASVVIVFELQQASRVDDLARRDERRKAVSDRADEVLESLGEDFQVTHRFNLVSALAGELDQRGLEALRNVSGIVSVGLDEGGSGGLSETIPLIGIDDVQSPTPGGLGIDGTGTKVAVLDSGIDASHPDFSGALQAEACFCANPNGDCCPNESAVQFGAGAAIDDHDHGTWVTGHIMSQGNEAPIGAAPGATLVAVKVLDSDNSFYSSADITAAYDWLATNHPDVDVVNASLGTSATFAGECDNETTWGQAMSQAVAALTANDAVVVAASGNDSNTSGIAVPSCLGDVIAVGATWKENRTGTFLSCDQEDPAIDDVACFSNHTPELDLLAPGALMITAQRGGGVSLPVSGTSFASPLVAGCAALIRQADPQLSAEQVGLAMVNSGVSVMDDRVGLSYPRLNCLNAVPAYQLNVNSNGASDVLISGSSDSSIYSGTTNYSISGIVDGTGITLSAPSAVGGAEFTGWNGCNSSSGASCQITMDQHQTVIANYIIPPIFADRFVNDGN